MQFEIQFSGHHNILSLHSRTIEITTERRLTPRGDCIIGVGATAGCADIPELMKSKIRDSNTKITIVIRVRDLKFTVCGRGHNDLELSNTQDIVIRTSGFVCPRTLAIHCNHASNQIPKEMISLLQDPNTRGVFTIIIPNDQLNQM